MKTKSIIFSGLLLASLGAATTSCEDMLSVDDELHTTNLAPQDTVYQIMGIINRMQSLVDRTLVLGELRADLVDPAKQVKHSKFLFAQKACQLQVILADQKCCVQLDLTADRRQPADA